MRASVLLNIVILCVELLDPTTSFVRVNTSSPQQMKYEFALYKNSTGLPQYEHNQEEHLNFDSITNLVPISHESTGFYFFTFTSTQFVLFIQPEQHFKSLSGYFKLLERPPTHS